MKCPSCSKQLEKKSYRGGIHVGECPWCNGVWFDAGELDSYHTAVGHTTNNEMRTHATFKSLRRGKHSSCPHCRRKYLVPGTVREIQVERCKKCHGVFVTREQILEIAEKNRVASDDPLSGLLLFLSMLP
jgi:Zn-finger nucleic acid-binding protein